MHALAIIVVLLILVVGAVAVKASLAGPKSAPVQKSGLDKLIGTWIFTAFEPPGPEIDIISQWTFRTEGTQLAWVMQSYDANTRQVFTQGDSIFYLLPQNLSSTVDTVTMTAEGMSMTFRFDGENTMRTRYPDAEADLVFTRSAPVVPVIASLPV